MLKKVVTFLSIFLSLTYLSTFEIHSQTNNNFQLAGPGSVPTVKVINTNKTTVGLYEKFEAILDLNNATYVNPYNPQEIDVQATFTSPTGKNWQIFGFYDDFNSVSQWKVRFSPNEQGKWHYIIRATDSNGTGESSIYTFNATVSDHRGWIRVSDVNPHYLIYDNGNQYYGVGVYSPWSNSVERLDRMEKFNNNIFGIWNISYGGLVNDHGLIEQRLGEYNQIKCGMTDSLLTMAEKRNIKIMYCIWPHDLFSETVWAHLWHNNPYSQICDVDDVYSDSTCWEYQKKKYRYLIARFGYSCSLGIWELINEMNGTDAWAHGRYTDCYEWVSRSHEYFKQNDPYNHPTTASFSGGYSEYRPELYNRNDIPNIHIYESQGWPIKFSGNLFRSSLYNYADAALRIWENFERPAIFGEAGYNNTPYPPFTEEYTKLIHNSIWGAFSNGLSCTPIWWDINILTDADLERYQKFRSFADSTDLLNEAKQPFRAVTNELDLFGMKNDTTAICWIREIWGHNISNRIFSIDSVLNDDYNTYAIEYYHTWNGEFLQTEFAPHINNRSILQLPELEDRIPDIAFYIHPDKNGTEPARLNLLSLKNKFLSSISDTSAVYCYILDKDGRFCTDATNLVAFKIEGTGRILGNENMNADKGYLETFYKPDISVGKTLLIASSPGLVSDTLYFEVTNKVIMDDFENFSSDEQLQSIWQTQSGTEAKTYLETDKKSGGKYSMRLEYELGGDCKATAQFGRSLGTFDFSGTEYFYMWLLPNNSGHVLNIRIRDQNRDFMYYDIDLIGTEPIYVTIPLEDFTYNDNVKRLDLKKLMNTSIKISQGTGSEGRGTIYFDDIAFLTTKATKIQENRKSFTPNRYILKQNYPNPFNPTTRIEYVIPQKSHVTVRLYNVSGQLYKTLVDAEQQAGTYSICLNASQMASGVYFYRIDADQFSAIRKCLLLK